MNRFAAVSGIEFSSRRRPQQACLVAAPITGLKMRVARSGVQRAVRIVRDPETLRADHEIPLFIHQLSGDVALEGFESPTLANGASYSHAFGTVQQSYPYHCKIHGVTMAGTITVQNGAPAAASVTIGDNFFSPQVQTVAPGGTVTWFNTGQHEHIVFAGGGGAASFCLNGRSYVGNTPTIVAEPGQRLRWYLLNLDVGDTWHNFHPHSARWRLPAPPGGAIDVHPLSPVESFTIDTEVPRALASPRAGGPARAQA